MKKNSFKNNLGFTLVELMVAISIIGILSAIVYANFGEARKAARDDVRKTSLKDLQLAIELYKAQNGVYPAQGNAAAWSGGTSGSYSAGANYIVGLVPDYIAALPFDPSPTPADRGIIYRTNGTDYKLLVYGTVESKRVIDYNDEFARCPSTNALGCTLAVPPTTTYGVYSAGAATW